MGDLILSLFFSSYQMLGSGWLDTMLAQQMLELLLSENAQTESDPEAARLIQNRLDLDGDGEFNTGMDGLLVFDFNDDGITSDDISRSQQLLSYLDDGGSGQIPAELQAMAGVDGILDSTELAHAHAYVWVDRNGDGRYDRGEKFAVGRDPIRSRAGKFVLNSLNLRSGQSEVSSF